MKTESILLKCFYRTLRLFVGKKKVDQLLKRKRVLKKAKIIQKYGEEAIITFDKIVKSEHSSYWLFWGTLLGAYRDKGFIKHDTDIDIGMFDTDIKNAIIDKMIEKGFQVLKVVVDKDLVGGYHVAFDYKGVKFDIYSFHKDCENTIAFNPVPFNYAKFGQTLRKDVMDIVHLTIPSWSSLNEVNFENIYCPIPSNSSDILKIIYGNDFMTPIIGKKPDDKNNQNIVHENPMDHYACVMNYETFKIIRKAGLI